MTVFLYCIKNFHVVFPFTHPSPPFLLSSPHTRQPLPSPLSTFNMSTNASPATEPVTDAAAEPVADPATELATEPVADPVADPTAKPVADSDDDSDDDSADDSAGDSTDNPYKKGFSVKKWEAKYAKRFRNKTTANHCEENPESQPPQVAKTPDPDAKNPDDDVLLPLSKRCCPQKYFLVTVVCPPEGGNAAFFRVPTGVAWMEKLLPKVSVWWVGHSQKEFLAFKNENKALIDADGKFPTHFVDIHGNKTNEVIDTLFRLLDTCLNMLPPEDKLADEGHVKGPFEALFCVPGH